MKAAKIHNPTKEHTMLVVDESGIKCSTHCYLSTEGLLKDVEAVGGWRQFMDSYEPDTVFFFTHHVEMEGVEKIRSGLQESRHCAGFFFDDESGLPDFTGIPPIIQGRMCPKDGGYLFQREYLSTEGLLAEVKALGGWETFLSYHAPDTVFIFTKDVISESLEAIRTALEGKPYYACHRSDVLGLIWITDEP